MYGFGFRFESLELVLLVVCLDLLGAAVRFLSTWATTLQELCVLDPRGAEKPAGNVIVSPLSFDLPLHLGRFWERLQTQH